MSQIPTSFTEAGARRIVAAVKDVESIDLRGGGAKRRAKGNGTGPHSFVIGRVTEVDSSDPLLVSVKEQYWADGEEGAAGDFAEVVGGRVWDTASDTLPQVRCVDGQPRAVDALVTLGHKFGPDNASQWFVVPEKAGMFRAKITASSSGSEDHTFVEIDADDAELTGGRTATDAKAMNGLRGVPEDTHVFMFTEGPAAAAGDPRYFFTVGEGQTGTPKTLTSTGTTAETTDWDREDQGSTLGVQFDPGRAAFATPDAFFFNRITTTDATGITTTVAGETAFVIGASADRSSVSGWITMLPVGGGAVGGTILHNEPGTDSNTLIFSPGTNITLNGGTADIEVEYDQLGHALIAKAGEDQTITIASTAGGGSADGQGYESVTDGTTTLNKTDGGSIAFSDTSNSSTTLGVNFAVANNDPTATVTATVDASGLTASDVGGAEVLDIEFRMADTVSVDDTFTIDSANYLGILFHGYVTTLDNSTAATWETYSSASTSIDWYHASSETVLEDFETLGAYNFFIDVSDGHKLKIRITSKPSGGNTHFGRILITKGSPKTAADVTFT